MKTMVLVLLGPETILPYLYVAFLLNIGPDAGWFSYVPLAGPDFSPGKRVDFCGQMDGRLIAPETIREAVIRG